MWLAIAFFFLVSFVFHAVLYYNLKALFDHVIRLREDLNKLHERVENLEEDLT